MRGSRPSAGARGLRASEPLLRPWLPVDLLDNAAQTISDNKAVMLGLPTIAGLLVIVTEAGLLQLTVPGGLASVFGQTQAPEQTGAAAATVVGYVVRGALYTIVATMLSGVIALAAVRSQLHARVGARELLRLVRPSMPALLGVGLAQALIVGLVLVVWFGFVVGAAVAIGGGAAAVVGTVLFLAGLPAAVVVGVRLSLAGTVVLLEGRRAVDIGLFVPARVGVAGSLRRSWHLVQGRFWRTVGVQLFAGVVLTIVGNALQTGIFVMTGAVTGWVGGDDADAATALSFRVAIGAGGLLATMATLSFVSAVLAMLYLDLRVRREGLDLWLRPALRPPGGGR